MKKQQIINKKANIPTAIESYFKTRGWHAHTTLEQQHDKQLSMNQILVNELGRQRNDQSAISKVSRCQQGRYVPTRPSITSKVSRQGREESAVRDSSPVEAAAAGARWGGRGRAEATGGFRLGEAIQGRFASAFFLDSGPHIYYTMTGFYVHLIHFL